MRLSVNIKNLGKVEDADIEIGKLTVFGGLNNTGKSFVSKFLYAIFKSFETNPFAVSLSQPIDLIKSIILKNDLELSSSVLKVKSELIEKLDKIQSYCNMDNLILCQKNIEDFHINLEIVSKIVNEIDVRNIKLLDDFYSSKLTKKSSQTAKSTSLAYQYNYLMKIANLDLNKFVEYSFTVKLKEQFIGNFSLSTLHDLANNKDKPISISINNSFTVIISQNNEVLVKSNSNTNILNNILMYSNVYYLDIQPIWKAEDIYSETSTTKSKGYSSRANIPNYVKDLLTCKLVKPNGGAAIYEDLLNKLYKVIGGKFVINKDSLFFIENSGTRKVHLDHVSSGIVQLGMLGFLIENSIINNKFTVFIDEPESNLHPELQIVMMNLLIMLVKSGATVLLSTHSSSLLKYLEIYVRKYKDFEKEIQLNHFTSSGVNTDEHKDFMGRYRDIMTEITDPFSKLF